MLTRQFSLLWADLALVSMLLNNCLICQEELEIDRLMAHLVAAHRATAERLHFVIYQLASVCANLMTEGGHCEWCDSVLPCNMVDGELVDCPEDHLVKCPLVIQISVFLMMPVCATHLADLRGT